MSPEQKLQRITWKKRSSVEDLARKMACLGG
ncbi:hypothetical protein A2U01_0039903, partial [Trifolium medium]|nr:hypothetical protein [Trifolium medium]